ncbi:MAG: Protein export cytoplasm protein SecA ATPase helicase [Gemmataceae bacterium]|nr:Protein export cytoplasm protein SecA ATPase helicase [Gemmataceae bacterium]
MLPLYHEPHFTFRFADDRIIPRFHLEGVEAGRRISVFRLDPATEEQLGLIATATVGEGGWVDLPEPIVVRAGDGFVAVPVGSSAETNHLGQPIGFPVPDWAPPALPPREAMAGRYCRVEPLDADRHAASLFESSRADPDGMNWTHLPYGPFDNFESYREWLSESSRKSDPLFFAIVDLASGKAVGVASYLRIDPRHGSVEVGHLNFSPALQRTPAATEAMYLMMERAFGLGYRRYEWKCNALNAPSRRAAQRLGLSFEGVFRQAAVYKGRNRDTAWYAAVDREWPALRTAFRRWLDPANFDEHGRQRVALSALTAPVLEQRG